MSMQSSAIYEWREPAPCQTRRRVAMSSKVRWSVQTTVGEGPGTIMRPEGLTEFRTLLLCPADPKVERIEEQVGPIDCVDASGRPFRHWLDQRIVYRDGTRVGMTVKPHEKAQRPEFREHMACVAAAAVPLFVDRFAIVTERHHDAVALRNAFLIHGCRRPDPEADEAIGHVVAAMGYTVAPLVDLAGRTGLGHRAMRALVRLLGRGVIETIEGGLVCPSTKVSVRRRDKLALWRHEELAPSVS